MLELSQIGELVKYSQDDIIVSEGELSSSMYIILNGNANVYISSFSDTPTKVAEIGKGDFFGEMSLLEDMPRSATIIASVDTIAIKIDRDSFDILLENRPDIIMKMLKNMSSRIRKCNEQITDLKTNDISTKKSINNDFEISNRPVKREEVKPSLRSANKNFNTKNLDPEKIKTLKDILPEHHHVYKHEIYTDEYTRVVMDKKVECPLCSEIFSVDLLRNSKMNFIGEDSLFRKVYDNINPLANNIWTCPNCHYSKYFYNYHALVPYRKKPIEDVLKHIKISINFKNNSQDNINIIFIKYFLAIYIEENAPNSNSMYLGKCWLNVHWLYKDVKDEVMAKYALYKAHYYYKDAYYNQPIRLGFEEELKLGVLVAELCFYCGEEKDAYLMLSKLVVDRDMPAKLKKYASDLMYAVKEKVKQLKKGSGDE